MHPPRVLNSRCLLLALAVAAGLPTPGTAQGIGDLSLGARVRASGDRTTNDGIRRFHVSGRLVSKDSNSLVIQRNDTPGVPADTVSLFGVRHLEVFRGLRSRRRMIVTGLAVGGVTGVIVWLAGRQFIGSDKSATVIDGAGNAKAGRSVVESARLSIPLLVGAGGLIGALIGPEHWERVHVPSSVFPEAR